MYCPNCGKEPGGGRYCSSCGFEISGNTSQPRNKFIRLVFWPFTIIKNPGLEHRTWFRFFRVLHVLLFVISFIIAFTAGTIEASNSSYYSSSTNWFAVIGYAVLAGVISLVLSRAIISGLVYIFGGKQKALK